MHTIQWWIEALTLSVVFGCYLIAGEAAFVFFTCTVSGSETRSPAWFLASTWDNQVPKPVQLSEYQTKSCQLCFESLLLNHICMCCLMLFGSFRGAWFSSQGQETLDASSIFLGTCIGYINFTLSLMLWSKARRYDWCWSPHRLAGRPHTKALMLLYSYYPCSSCFFLNWMSIST